MAKSKKKKINIECDHCEESCVIQFTTKSPIQCCPFCGEEVVVKEDDLPLLNTLEELDEFNEARYYDEAEEEYEDDDEN